MIVLRCDAYNCTQETMPKSKLEAVVKAARQDRWLVQVNGDAHVSWCPTHRATIPQWHVTLRAGDISEYL
jgi:hypothetical protein